MTRPRTTPRTRSQRYVRCRTCGKDITLNNFSTHVKALHPALVGQPRPTLYDEVDGVAPAVVSRALALPAVAPAHLPPLGLDDVDGIVLGVVQQLAEPSGLLPVEVLPAVFAWRSATASFLATIEGLR